MMISPSNRSTGEGLDDIYSFVLLKSFKVSLSVQGVIADSRSNDIIPNATVQLVNSLGNVIATIITDEQGNYSFELEEDQDYTINVHKEDYFDNSGTLTTKNITSNVEQIKKYLTLEKDPGLALYALIIDTKTATPLEGVQIKITDNETGAVFLNELTKSTGYILKGIVDKKIDDQISYTIELVKKGYFSKTIIFTHLISEVGQIDVNSILNGSLEMDAEVKDFPLLINPINFDLGKWNIRPDAEIELNKIVEVMNKYSKMIVELGAHADCRASAVFNMELSDKRAKSSAKYIQERITNPERISGKGYGESLLLNDCGCEGAVKSYCSEEEHQVNRRAEFLVISSGDDKVKATNTSKDSFEH
jgi:outer membrane protein OmpA-like peptidoglycan-associated protein